MDYNIIIKGNKDNAKATEEDVGIKDLKWDSIGLEEIVEGLGIMSEKEIKEATEFNIDRESCITV
ncbi:MAG: hypothetical protein KJI71_00440 [Patescibacteria group bacterium]|nr:hypothetical protein [Patescibacteria group bacterium]